VALLINDIDLHEKGSFTFNDTELYIYETLTVNYPILISTQTVTSIFVGRIVSVAGIRSGVA
jgi:hypothetical protein